MRILWKKLSLSGKLLVAIIPSVGLVLLALFALLERQYYLNESRELARSLKELTQTQSQAITRALWEMDDALLQRELAALGRLPYVQGAEVTDPNGDILAAVGELQTAPAKAAYLSSRELRVDERGVGLEGGQAIGRLRIIVHEGEILARLGDHVHQRLLTLTLVMLAIGASILAATRTILGGPLARLREAIELSMRENRRLPVDLDVSDELGKVQLAFNVMQAAREAAQQEVQRHQKHLEALVAERTRALAKSEARSRLTLESIDEGVFGMDSQGRITFANPKCAELLQYPAEQLAGQPAHALFHPADAGERACRRDDCWMGRPLLRGERVHLEEALIWRADGEAVEIECHAAPMREEGELVGAVVSFMDIGPRKLTQRQRDDALAVISSSIEYASRIQRSLLPSHALLDRAIPEYFVLWEPRDVVGGDMYWFRPWGKGDLLVLGDCTGHGVPGAFMTMISSGALDQAILETPPGDPAILLQRMHQLIQGVLSQGDPDGGGESDDGLEAGACFLDQKQGMLIFAGARFSLFQVREGEVTEIKGTKTGIGYRGVPNDLVIQNHPVEIGADVTFYLTSDGIIDQVGGRRRRSFGKKRLKELLAAMSRRPLQEQKKELLRAFAAFLGEESRRDDISAIGFRVEDRGTRALRMEPVVAAPLDASLAVGWREIDADHARLIALIDRLDRVLAHGVGLETLQPLLEELASYTVWHFRHEERLMKSHHYPDMERHFDAHEQLANQVQELLRRAAAGNAPSPDELTGLLRGWLVDHIQNLDAKLGAYLALRASGY